ncbi:MAG: hypothetical protein K0Q54_4068 [Methylobacterium brachiatum]|nr:hypothetical protein [Methylobacterium brachiatum]
MRSRAISARVGQVTQAGIRLRAARKPTGRAITIPITVAITAICTLSTMPDWISSHREKFGGNIRARNWRPWLSPVAKRSGAKPSWLAA